MLCEFQKKMLRGKGMNIFNEKTIATKSQGIEKKKILKHTNKVYKIARSEFTQKNKTIYQESTA